MTNEKNTDKIIREKLESFSASPPAHIWNNIQGQMAAQKRRKKILFAGWIAAAALVVLAFVAGWYFNENTDNDNFSTAENERIEINKNNAANKSSSSETEIESDGFMENESSTLIQIASAEIPETAEKIWTDETNRKEITSSNIIPRQILNISKIESLKGSVKKQGQKINLAYKKLKTVPNDYLTLEERALVAGNLRSLPASSDIENNWKMGMYISPGYSSHVANHSESYSKQMTYSENKGNTNLSGGVSVQYKTGKKLSLESGIYYAQNGQKSENSIQFFALDQEADRMFAPSNKSYFANAVNVENGNLVMNSTAGVIALSGTPKGAEISADFESLSGVSNSLISNGEFSQVFDFVEIPLYVRYRLVDSKFGIELLGGVNAGVVIGNNAFIDNEFGLQNIGQTQDISTLNVSGVAGLGFNYALGKNLSLAIEPRVNYYLNSINRNPNVDFRPYRIGIFTGLSYEF